jgi:hypothetical protein
MPSPPAAHRRGGILLGTPVLWAALGFGAYFHFAQFIRTVGWNTIELIISQHLTSHGVYAMSLDYPSAVIWRPVLPTLLVTGLRLFTGDPILIYQWFCGTTVAVMAACLFYAARRLSGLGAAHLAAGLTLACPAVTTHLIDHIHSYSHLGGLLFLGPALLVGLELLQFPADERPRTRLYAISGALWGLAFLCRSELMMFAGAQGAALAWMHFWRRRSQRPLGAYALAFLAFYLPYNLYGAYIAQRDELLIRKSIYGFYASQGWVDPAPGSGADSEAAGYVYAVKLYGDPLANGESAFTAIRRHPEVFARRVRLNLRNFYRDFTDPNFFSPWVGAAALLTIAALAAGLVPPPDRLAIVFLWVLFAATHFVVIFHIDTRYLTIAAPPLILLAAYGAILACRRLSAPGAGRVASGLALAAGFVYVAHPQYERVTHPNPYRDPGIAAMRSLGEYFRSAVPPGSPIINREPHIGLVFPSPTSIPPEDEFLLAYFARTAYVNHGADGPFPRGRLYSFRECEDDYTFVPVARYVRSWRQKVVGECEAPGMGRYYLLKTVP